MLPAGLKPGQSPAAGAKFVICEICDGYIKDLEQLRNHMQWMHKVKVGILFFYGVCELLRAIREAIRSRS